jgi:DNA-binding MarR family transcriptional regulator
LEKKLHNLLTDLAEDIIKNIRKGEPSERIAEEAAILNLIGDERTCNMKHLTDELGLPPSTATRQVTRLVELGLIERRTPQNNRRTVLLTLTQKGEERRLFYRKQHADMFRLVINDLSRKEQEILIKALEKIFTMRTQKKKAVATPS